MNAQQLKNAILQEAIEGRLVPQDPNDGIFNPANNYITPKKISNFDDYLFDIPESWKWCKMFQVSDILGGFAFKSEDLKSSNGIRVIRISDIAPQGLTNKNIVRCSLEGVPDRYSIKSNDILIAMTGGTVGKSLLLRSLPEPIYLNQRVAVIRARNDIYINYLDLLIKSPLIQKIICDVKNSTNDNISMADISGFPIPLPPLAEQYRIVAKIEELLPKVEEYGKAQEALDRLNSELSERLKKSILQEAIEGRLVPQVPNDEPASALLDRIRKEKAQLVKAGKLKKKDLEETPITEEEKPFEIPESWEWVRIRDIFIINPKVQAADGLDAAFIPMEKISACYGSAFTFEIRKWGVIKSSFTCFQDGDVAFAKITPCFQNRKSMILEGLPNGIGAGTTELKVLRQYGETINRTYLLYFLESSYFVDEASFKGTANQQRIIVGYLENKPFPLPPLAEQHRIVAKIEELFGAINALP